MKVALDSATLSSSCYHCGLALPVTGPIQSMVHGVNREFCCAACHQVCLEIHDAGLRQFYGHAPATRNWSQPTPHHVDFTAYDDTAMQSEFVTQDEHSVMTGRFIIGNLHCPACVWLIESALRRLPGVTYAEVNLTRQMLRVCWKSGQTIVSTLMSTISRIGYSLTPYSTTAYSQTQKMQRQDLLLRMAFAGFVTMNVMAASLSLYAGDFFGIEPEWQAVFKWYGMVFALGALIYSARPLFHSAAMALRHSRVNMDVPICAGLLISFVYSLFALIQDSGRVYFDSVAMFIFLILVGRFLELSARETASFAWQHLASILPNTALRVHPTGVDALIPIAELKVGDHVRIKPGARVPVDGVVLEGVSVVDESLLTGESIPVDKLPGHRVVGGSLNGTGTLVVEATDVGAKSVLSTIQQLVDTAQSAKLGATRLADRVVPYFVGAVLVIATLTFMAWFILGTLDDAMRAAIAVLIISCPCALGLAAPMAIAVGTGVASTRGILFKNPAALEILPRVNHVAFDKTGTLTRGAHRVHCADVTWPPFTDLWDCVHAIEIRSEHPIARAVAEYARGHLAGDDRVTVSEFAAVPGRGVHAIITRANGHASTLWIGSADWVTEHQVVIPPATRSVMKAAEDQSLSIVCVFTTEHLVAWFGVGDPIVENIAGFLDQLSVRGLEISVVSGDREATVMATIRSFGPTRAPIAVDSAVLPVGKVSHVQRFQQQGKTVAMVGDGINDTPALAAADVGVAVARATDASVTAADVVLLAGIHSLVPALEIARATLRAIKTNLAFSLGYNILMLPLAVSGWVTPLIAAIAMPLSSMFVIINALRIKRRIIPSPMSDGECLNVGTWWMRFAYPPYTENQK